MTVKEAIEFLKRLDQDLPLILYQDMPTFGNCPMSAGMRLIQLNKEDAEMLSSVYGDVGQEAVMIS